jgi:diaminopimelate epimerase
MAASRAVYSRIGRIEPERGVVIRNAGGMATVSLRVLDEGWCPVLEGNATFVYRAAITVETLVRGLPEAAEREPYPDELRAYSALDERNADRLRAVGIESAALSSRTAQMTD